MRIRNPAWLAVGIVALGVGSLGAGKGPEGRLEQAKREMMAADREFSRVTGEQRLAGFVTFMDDSVGTLRPDSPVIHGREAMAGRWKRLLDNADLSLDWEPIYAEASGSGDFGFTVGRSVFKQRGEKGWEVAGTGKYVTVWRRQQDGSWKVLFDSGVNDSPPDTTKK